MKKLRLIMTEECNRSCEGCCNNDFDISALPTVRSFSLYDKIMITGGEPMLHPKKLVELIHTIRADASLFTKIILYTAKSKRALDLIAMLNWVDGITLTLHEQYDVAGFIELNDYINLMPFDMSWSLRLNVFKGVTIPDEVNTENWKIKDNIEWIKDCPLPENEVLMRI